MKRDVYVARQPIFNRKMNLYGYELLYRQSSDNDSDVIDDDASTISLINNTVLVFGFNQLIDYTRGFVRFSESLLKNEIALMLPKEKAVIEITKGTTPTPAVLDACTKLKRFGYTIALDDFSLDADDLDADDLRHKLIQLADIIKIDFDPSDLENQRRTIQKYTDKLTFLAKNVETAEQYQMAAEIGYDLFLGNFFSSPVIVKSRDIQSLDVNLFRIIEELNKPSPDLKAVSSLIEMDLGLSYKLLKMVNSVAYGTNQPIQSIHQAVVYFGIKETSRWANLIFLKGFQHKENSEMIKMSLIRGRLMSLLAVENHDKKSESDCFITGLFSFIDLLLGNSMEKIVADMPFTDAVRDALLGKKNRVRMILDIVIAFEIAEFEEWNRILSETSISRERFMELYLQALTWQQALPS